MASLSSSEIKVDLDITNVVNKINEIKQGIFELQEMINNMANDIKID